MMLKDENGFTLTEMLVSLVIFSLSLAIIWQGAGLVSRLNNRVKSQKAETAQIQRIEAELSAKLLPLQPVTDSQLMGSPTHLEFECEPKATSINCSYNAPLGHFVYMSEGARYTNWPPAKPKGVSEAVRLTALALENDRGKSLALIKFPVEHTANCQFDMISRTCRSDDAFSEAIQ